MDTLCSYCGGGYQHQPTEEEIVPLHTGLMKGPEMSPCRARDACCTLVVMWCFPSSPGKLSRSYGHISWAARTSGKEGQPLLGVGSMAGAWGIRCSPLVPFSAPSSSQCQTPYRGGGWWVCLLAALRFPALARDFARCFVNLGGDKWVWVEALPQPDCLILRDCHGHITDAGAKSKAWPWISESGLFRCVAELCRKGFSESRCLDFSGFWERRFEASRAGSQCCQLRFASTCLMEFIINFLNSLGSEWPPKDWNSGSANSPSALGRTKACHSPSGFLCKAKNKPPSPSCDCKTNKKPRCKTFCPKSRR